MNNTPCLHCEGPVARGPRDNNKKFCSVRCRNKALWQRVGKERTIASRAKWGAYAEGKIQCKLCDRWYVKPMAHVWQQHNMTEQEYKEYFDLPLSKGIIPEEHRQLLSRLALENDMDKQLMRAGRRTRYIKGDPRAKMRTGWKGIYKSKEQLSSA